MDLEKCLEQIQTNFEEQRKAYEAKIKALEESHAEKIAAYELIERVKGIERVQKEAEKEEISVDAWIMDAITEALAVPDGHYIKVHNKVYEKLRDLAKSRGQNVNDMTTRDGLTEAILTALMNRSI